MSIAPVDIFIFACWLNDTKPAHPSEILIRSIINRAYYAALISARDYIDADTRGSGGHVQVVRALRHHDRFAGNKLDSLRLKRRLADYEPERSFTPRDAEISLQDSRAVLFAVGCAPPVSPKPYTSNFLDSSKFL